MIAFFGGGVMAGFKSKFGGGPEGKIRPVNTAKVATRGFGGGHKNVRRVRPRPHRSVVNLTRGWFLGQLPTVVRRRPTTMPSLIPSSIVRELTPATPRGVGYLLGSPTQPSRRRMREPAPSREVEG